MRDEECLCTLRPLCTRDYSSCSLHDEEPLEILAARYKPVDKKVRPVAAPVPAELQLPGVDVEPTGGKRLTDERLEVMQVGDGLLTDVEVD